MNNETEAEEVTGTRLTFYCVSSQAIITKESSPLAVNGLALTVTTLS